MTSDTLAETWQGYWRGQSPETGSAIWDSDPTQAAEIHLRWFGHYFDSALPLLDIGCGNGTQAGFLGHHYARVIGLDVAPAAVALAQARHGSTNVEFRTLDITKAGAIAQLHAEIGDANAYVRGLLHQLPADLRASAATSIAALIGATGTLFAVELAPSAAEMVHAIATSPQGAGAKLQRVLDHRLTPAAWPDGELDRLLDAAGLVATDGGPAALHTTEIQADGSFLILPMQYIIASSRRP